MAGTFFEFGTALPVGIDEDPRDPGFGIDDEEEEYDALNDETFGTTIDDDWEQSHEKLAEFTEQSRVSRDGKNDNKNRNSEIGNEHDEFKNDEELEAKVSQLVLEEFDDLDNMKRLLTRSQTNHSHITFSESPSAFHNSVWSVGKHDMPSPLALSSPLQPRPSMPTVKNVCTVEELERNLLQMRNNSMGSIFGPLPNASNVAPTTLRLEDVERKLTQGLPQPRFNTINDSNLRFLPGMGRGVNLLNAMQNQRMVGGSSNMVPISGLGIGPGRVEPKNVTLRQLPIGFNSNAPHPHQQHGFQAIRPNSGLLPMGPQQFNLNGPRLPLFPSNNRHLEHHPPHQMMYNQHRRNNNAPYHQHGHFDGYDDYGRPNRSVNGSGDYDEYAGLMTSWQKQWLLNIQILQLNVGAPYIVDYYYTVYKNRKQDSRTAQLKPNVSGRDRPSSTKPNRERPPSVMSQGKTYTPLQFENSLGKLQCVSVTAPRRLIDMDIMSMEGSESSLSIQRDLRKKKQLLLEIERLYVLLLDLEDAFSPLAITCAAEAAAAKALRDPPDTENEPEKLPPEELIQKMISSLTQEEKVLGILGIRKGKTLLLRLLPHVALDAGLHTMVFSQILIGFANLIRRDQGEALLPRFFTQFQRWLEVCELAEILKISLALSTEISVKSKYPRTALGAAVSTAFGKSLLGAILTASERHLTKMTEDQKKHWGEFLSHIAIASVTLAVSSLEGEKLPELSETLQCHIDHCNSSVSSKNAVILKNFFVGCEEIVSTTEPPCR